MPTRSERVKVTSLTPTVMPERPEVCVICARTMTDPPRPSSSNLVRRRAIPGDRDVLARVDDASANSGRRRQIRQNQRISIRISDRFEQPRRGDDHHLAKQGLGGVLICRSAVCPQTAVRSSTTFLRVEDNSRSGH